MGGPRVKPFGSCLLAARHDADSRQTVRHSRTATSRKTSRFSRPGHPSNEALCLEEGLREKRGSTFSECFSLSFLFCFFFSNLSMAIFSKCDMQRSTRNEPISPDLIADKSQHVVADSSRDRCLNRCGEYSKVHICVIQRRQQENRHPIRYDPE